MLSGRPNEIKALLERNKAFRRENPYVFDTDFLRNKIVYVPATSRHQAAKDWVRNRKVFYINDVSVNTLIDEIKTKIITNLQNYFRDHPGAVLDSPEVKQIISPLEFPLEEMSDLNKLIQEINELFVQSDGAFENNARLLEYLWRTRLINPTLSPEKQNAYIEKLFEGAHQGGYLHSLVPIYVQALEGTIFKLASADLLKENSMVVRFTTVDSNIEITESYPTSRISEEKPDGDLVDVIEENADQQRLFLFEPESIHSLKIDNNKKVDVKLEYVRNKIYSKEILDIMEKIMPELQALRLRNSKLEKYAENYIQKGGHDAAEAEKLLHEYPELQAQPTVKKSYSSFLLGRAEAHQNADKIFYFLGTKDQKFIDDLVTRADEFTQSKNQFVYFMKLLCRLGNPALEENQSPQSGYKKVAFDLLKKYYAQAGVRDINLNFNDLNEKKFGEAYDYFVKHNAFADNSFEKYNPAYNAELLTNAEKGLSDYIRNRSFELMQHRSSLFKSVNEENRGLVRAQAYSYLLREAADDFAKRIVIFALLRNTDSKTLRAQIEELVKPATLENYKTAIKKDLVALQKKGFDYSALKSEVIGPLNARANNLATKDIINFSELFDKYLAKIKEFQPAPITDRPRPYK